MPFLPDWLTGYDAANADAAAKADAVRQGLDRQAVITGKITQAEADRRAAQGYGVDKASQRQEIDDTFAASVKDNATALSAGIHDGLLFTVWRILSAVPLIIWIIAVAGGFIYFGGPLWLKKKLAK